MRFAALALALLMLITPATASDPEEPRPLIMDEPHPYHEGPGLSMQVCYETPDQAAERARWGDEEMGCWGGGIPDALVTIEGPDGFLETYHTQPWGDLWLDLPEGTYTASADPTGFEAGDITFTVPTHRVSLILSPQPITLSGTLTDSDGNGIEGHIATHAQRTRSNESTDSQGRFSMALPAGHHAFEVYARGYQGGFVHAFVDGSIEPTWILTHGDEGDWVEGTVRDQHGEPIAGAHLEFWSMRDYECCDEQLRSEPYVISDGRDDWQEATSDRDGTFRVQLSGTQAHVSMWARGYQDGWQEFMIDGQPLELSMAKMPDKDAYVHGKIFNAETGKPVTTANLHIENQAWHDWACSQNEAEEDRWGRYDHGDRCPITIHADGTFEGHVMPGYSIVEVYAYQDCHEVCEGDEYIPYVATVRLVSGDNGAMDIALQPFAAPSAKLSGYILDADGRAVAGAGIDFSNEETRGWGHTQADEFGSYQVLLRPGWHRVSVWAHGFYHWQGMIEVTGDHTDLVVTLEADAQQGGCCYGGFGPKHMPMELIAFGDHEMARAIAHESEDGFAANETQQQDAEEEAESSSGADFQDLGGLGKPYDPSSQQGDSETTSPRNITPGPAIVLLGLGLLLLARRK